MARKKVIFSSVALLAALLTIGAAAYLSPEHSEKGELHPCPHYMPPICKEDDLVVWKKTAASCLAPFCAPSPSCDTSSCAPAPECASGKLPLQLEKEGCCPEFQCEP